MQWFCQRNLLGMFFPRKKDEPFALSTCSGLSWHMVIRGWRWPSPCITWDASRSSSAGRLLSGGSRKALTTRCSGLSPSFSTNSSSIQQTLAFSLCSAHTVHHQAHIKTYHFCDFSHTALSLACFDLLSWLSFIFPGSLLPWAGTFFPDGDCSRTYLL